MRKILIGLLLVSTFSAHAETGDAKVCPVDDRVNDLSTVISDIDAGKLQKNVQLSAETLISLKPKVVALLKDKYEVVKTDCSTIKVIAGEPNESVSIDFPLLFNELVKAVSAKDDVRIKWLIASFKPQTMTGAQAFGSLMVPAPVPSAISDQLATLLNINKMQSAQIQTQDKKWITESFVLLSEVFRTLGGQLTATSDLPKTKVYNFGQQYSRDAAVFEKAAVQSMATMKCDINPMFDK